METVILDSDVLIFVSRNDPATIAFVEELEQSSLLVISSVTAIELTIGCQNKSDLNRVKKFLSRYRILHLNESASATAVRLVEEFNLSHGLLLPDALIAASAIVNGFSLATINKKDFRFIDGLKLIDYP